TADLVAQHAAVGRHAGHAAVPTEKVGESDGADDAQLTLGHHQQLPVFYVARGEDGLLHVADKQRVAARIGQIQVATALAAHKIV
ncbi:ORFL77W, partial [Human betaherpesvirus 5]